MHNPSISILGPGPDVMLIEGFDCSLGMVYRYNTFILNLGMETEEKEQQEQ